MKDRTSETRRRNSRVALNDTARHRSLDVRRELDDLCRRNHEYQQEIARLKEELGRSTDRERTLTEALTASQGTAAAARKESTSIVQEAEKRASRIVEEARSRVNTNQPWPVDLKRERKLLQDKVQESIDIIQKLLPSSNVSE